LSGQSSRTAVAPAGTDRILPARSKVDMFVSSICTIEVRSSSEMQGADRNTNSPPPAGGMGWAMATAEAVTNRKVSRHGRIYRYFSENTSTCSGFSRLSFQFASYKNIVLKR
jgi:hypothetical protein